MRWKTAVCPLLIALSLAPAPAPAQAQDKPRPTIGLVLEGGGALALAHVGVIEWFERNRIPIDFVAGASMGGLVGGFYASGMSGTEMRQTVNELNWNELLLDETNYKHLAFRRKQDIRELGNTTVVGLRHGLVLPTGLNSGQPLDLLLSKLSIPYAEMRSFNDLPTPFRCIGTDLLTSREHVFDSGSLAQALRATMSIPGFFTPVLKKGEDGKIHQYVDGGLLNNLPVDVVKAMGADIVIAVHLITNPYDPAKPQHAIDIMGRAVSTIMLANERHNMERADLLVPITLNGFAVNDFAKAQQIMDRGLEGGEKRKLLLSQFALNEPAWSTFQQQRQSRRKTITRVPEFISIELPDTKLANHLQTYFAGQIGKPLDPKFIESQILKIMGMGVFAHISYAPIERDGKLGLAIYINRSDSRPPTLRPAVKLDGADYLNTRFALAARITMSDLGGFRSEWRNDILFGSAYGIRSEYFRPFTPLSKWFLAPRAFAENRPLDFYRRSRILAQYRDHKAGGGLDLGYSIGNTGELRAGYESAYRSSIFRVGESATYPTIAGRYGATQISYTFDRVDDDVIPHSGVLAETKFRWVDANPGSPGRFPVLDAKAAIFHPFGDRITGFVTAEGGTVFNTKTPGLPFYFLGGPLRLSAYGMNELIGNQFFLGRAGVLRQLNKSAPLTIGRLYLFGAVEAGKMYGAQNTTRLPMDATAGFLVRTMLGPLFLGGGIGDAGHRKLFFQLGRVF